MATVCSWGLFGCYNSDRNTSGADRAYYWHYRNIDSTRICAEKILHAAGGKSAVALNDLAFVDIAEMEYVRAEERLKKIAEITDNQIELTIADVQMMRICQRRSMNKEFYDYYNRAAERLKRIYEDDDFRNAERNDDNIRRLAYAESEFDIVSSTYYYYVGLQEKSEEALSGINLDELIQIDSAQTANFCYNVGSNGNEYALKRCLFISRKQGYKFFEANCLQALAENSNNLEQAKEALQLFKEYGDVYQIAGAYRTIANCYIADGNYAEALVNLKKALNENPRIDYAPDLLASIHERLSVVYAAIGNMEESLYNRREYLSLQEGKRQDRFLENRIESLEKESVQRSLWMLGVVVAIIVLLLLLVVFYRMRRTMEKRNEKEAEEDLQRLKDRYEEVVENKAVAEQKLTDLRRKNEENRAKINLVNSVIPLIDRMVHTADRQPVQMDYIREITDEINRKNELLTEWIQMRQGDLNMKIETFSLHSLFEILKKSKANCQMKGIVLDIVDTDAEVKADKILTMFMLNTLVDNARKFTDAGGKITVWAEETENYVEISVKDTGKGIAKEDLPVLFNHKIHDNHGFGLVNCKGIIEKYRKVSGLFRNAMIAAESELGKGSRLYFRLPKGKNLGHANVKNAIAKSVLPAVFVLAGLLMPSEMKAQTAESMDSMAVEALKNRDFDSYDKYNMAYIRTLKENSVDKTLPIYCKTMQEGDRNKKIAMILLTMILLSIVPLYYLQVWRFAKKNRQTRESLANSIAEQKTQIEMAQDECHRVNMEISGVHVSNNVLDNCLSALKHETMYYPNRIRLMVDAMHTDRQADMDALNELISYYRSLYMILDGQAMRETDKFKMNMQKVPAGTENILGDPVLIDYLFELLGNPTGYKAEARGEYVVIQADGIKLSEIQYLICRQIIRDHAEMSARRACGIEVSEEKNSVTIKLPRYGKI